MDHWLVWVFIAYLCGSIPFALLIGKAHGVDVRKVGSGNIGATNVGRALGLRWGRFCLLLDVLKGLIPVALAGASMGVLGEVDRLAPADAWGWLAVATAAVLGHVFPVWLKFRGGKGVATGLGVLLGVFPVLTLAGLLAGAVWFVLAKLFHYVSLASVAAAISLPIWLLLGAAATGRLDQRALPFLVVTSFLALLVVVRHRGNLARLRAGTESRRGS